MHQPKILIIGAGISGLMAALKFAEYGTPVVLLSQRPARRSDSSSIRSGMSAAIQHDGLDDSSDRHFSETILSGDFLANQRLPKEMCEEAPYMVHLLERMGVFFNRSEEGYLNFSPTEGSPYERTLFSAGSTGKRILDALDGQVYRCEKDGLIQRFEGWDFISLVKDGLGAARGIIAQNRKTMDLKIFRFDALVVCTGGIGALYSHCTQSMMATGSAASVLYQAGAHYANGEFIQMNPATIQTYDKCISIIGPALSQGGRYWVPREGKPWYFLEELYPSMGNHVPYVVAARVIHKVIYEMGLGVEGTSHVYLDVSHQKGHCLKEALGELLNVIQKFAGVDPMTSPIPVAPAVSYSPGGLWTDDNHMTNIPGVFAAGECQYQYHGASALEDNIILSSLFGGMHAARYARHYALGLEKGVAALDGSLFDNARLAQYSVNRDLIDQAGSENPHLLSQELKNLMSENVGLIRQNSALKNAVEKIKELKTRYRRICLNDRGSWMNEELLFTRQLWNEFELAHVITLGALLRDESRGSHYKPEFPKRNDHQFLKSSKASWAESGPVIEYEDVSMKYLKP